MITTTSIHFVTILFLRVILLWQPPEHDDTLIGLGTSDEPLGVNTDTIATKDFVTSSIISSDTFATYDSVNTLISGSAYTAPYDEYVAFIGQTGSGHPTSVVHETLAAGSVSWTRIDVGIYHGACTGCFTVNKRFASATYGVLNSGEPVTLQVDFIDANTARIYTTAGALPVELDGEVYLSIRIYP